MKRIAVYPYKIGSESAKALVTNLGNILRKKVFQIRGDSRIFRPREKIILNWGNSHLPEAWQAHSYLNPPPFVAIAGNKLETFRKLQGHVNIPEYTTDRAEAIRWLQGGTTIISRATLTGHSGAGIQVLTEGDLVAQVIPTVPLYVQYKKKRKEFRVHVFQEDVIDVQEKRKERDVDVDFKIRNRANGWVFCREDIVEPADLREQALLAVAHLGLDFGAVDVIWNEMENKCYVLEINTAPGIEGTTLENYTKAIIKYLGE